MSKKKKADKIDHGIETKKIGNTNDDEYKIDTRYKDMIPIKRYKHHTLFWKPSLNGKGFHECFLNIDIDREKQTNGKDVHI